MTCMNIVICAGLVALAKAEVKDDYNKDTIIEDRPMMLEILDHIRNLDEKVNYLDRKVDSLLHQNSSRMATTVAFTACPSADLSYSPGTTIKFGEALTNIGGFFSTDTGIFTCPVNGLYLFSISILTTGSINVNALIKKDGNELVKISSSNAGDIHGVNSIITECNIFQPVWVECVDNGGIIPGDRRSSFTGVLLVEYS